MRHPLILVGSLALFLALGTVAVARAEVVSICHVPPGDPESARVLTVGGPALGAHLGHGDTVVPDDLGCTAGVGECRADGLLQCTPAGLVCDAVAFPAPEPAETSCSDGLDNDCDGSSDQADEDCIVACPDTSNLQAAITKQIEALDSCTVAVEILSLTDHPIRLHALSVDAPEDVVVSSVGTSNCTSGSAGFVCRHNMVFDYTVSLSFNGSYVLHLQDQCDPFVDCPLCQTGEEEIAFSLAGVPCEVTEISPEPGDVGGTVWMDTDGDGVRDAGEPTLSLTTAMVKIYEDGAPFDGLPDGPALTTGGIDVNDGHYGFAGLDGVYVIELVGPAGTCPSSGPDSRIDPGTGFTIPFSVLATDPKTVLSGWDMGLTTVCP